jgi:hypothetical protein
MSNYLPRGFKVARQGEAELTWGVTPEGEICVSAVCINCGLVEVHKFGKHKSTTAPTRHVGYSLILYRRRYKRASDTKWAKRNGKIVKVNNHDGKFVYGGNEGQWASICISDLCRSCRDSYKQYCSSMKHFGKLDNRDHWTDRWWLMQLEKCINFRASRRRRA